MTVEMKNITQYFINQKDTWNKLQLTTWNLSRILINRINIPLLMKHIQELSTSWRGQDFILFCLSFWKRWHWQSLQIFSITPPWDSQPSLTYRPFKCHFLWHIDHLELFNQYCYHLAWIISWDNHNEKENDHFQQKTLKFMLTIFINTCRVFGSTLIK